MRIAKVIVFPYSELSEKAKEKVMSKFGDINVDYEWWDSLCEDALNIGLKIDAFDLDRNSHVVGHFIESPEDVANNIFREHGKSCDTYATAQDYLLELSDLEDKCYTDHADEEYPEDFLDTEDINKEFLRSLCEDYRIMLQKEYEYRLSREAVEESIIANEFEFTEDGKLF